MRDGEKRERGTGNRQKEVGMRAIQSRREQAPLARQDQMVEARERETNGKR